MASGSLRYDRVLIATGAAPVIPAGGARRRQRPGAPHAGGRVALRVALGPGVRLSIVGAGLVGQEVAATAVAAGASVTLIDRRGEALRRAARAGARRLARPTCTAMPASTSAWPGASSASPARGVCTRCASTTAPTWRATTSSWRRASGPRRLGSPAAGWTRAAPRSTARGARACRDVFAAGDAACAPDGLTGRHRPAGHWEAAARQGAAAARAMLDLPMRPAAPAVVWSDQYGVRLQRIGDPRGADRVTVDGDLRRRDFVLTYHRAGRPVAAALAGRPQALPGVRRRLLARAPSDPNRRPHDPLPIIDAGACLAHGDCAALAPDVFAVRGDLAVVVGDGPEDLLLPPREPARRGRSLLVDRAHGRGGGVTARVSRGCSPGPRPRRGAQVTTASAVMTTALATHHVQIASIVTSSR